jgi:hypothetical protein
MNPTSSERETVVMKLKNEPVRSNARQNHNIKMNNRTSKNVASSNI